MAHDNVPFKNIHGNLFHTQAADVIQVLGIGRNEYIAMLNQCKGRRLMWRMNPRVSVKE